VRKAIIIGLVGSCIVVAEGVLLEFGVGDFIANGSRGRVMGF
jgi:hypothetical protein